jgi:hypothetical protein
MNVTMPSRDRSHRKGTSCRLAVEVLNPEVVGVLNASFSFGFSVLFSF